MLVHACRMFYTQNRDSYIVDFKRNVLNSKIDITKFQLIKNYYSILLNDRKNVETRSPGPSSKYGNEKITVSDYARRTSVSFNRGIFLARIAAHYKPDVIVELGTSLGISTMFLSSGSPDSQIITIEGNSQIADLAEKGFKKYEIINAKLIKGMFDEVIADIIPQKGSSFMVFIDGNHTYQATLNYLKSFAEAFLIVIDDIRWSKDMIRAWREIRKNASFTIIDLYSTGLIIKGGTRKQYSLCPLVI